MMSVTAKKSRRGVSMVEIMAVVGIIILLVGILLPALSVASGNARWANSQNSMRQIYQLMREYTTDHRETIVPAAFDYRESGYTGKVRSSQPPGAVPNLSTELGKRVNYGTWTDVLFTYGKFTVPPISASFGGPAGAWNYRFDSPDRTFYEFNDGSYDNIFRSSVQMGRTPGGTEATPYGTGAQTSETSQPGYFAANLLFDSRPGPENLYGEWRTSADVRRPANTMYLVDSTYGETIEPTPEGFGSPMDPDPALVFPGQVDFRYPGRTALMLFLDGHIGTETEWEQFDDLREIRNIQVDSLK